MKSINKILLTTALLAGAGYTYAKPAVATTVNAGTDVQDRHLSGFNGVDVSGSFDVYITQGLTELVRVEAPKDVIDRIVTEVKDGELKIRDKHDSNWNFGSWFHNNHKKIAVYVTAKNLDNIGITGSGDVYFKDGIRAGNLKLWVTGSGDVIGKVETKSLETNISGSGDVKLSGRAESSHVSVSGSGDFSGKGLATVNTSVHVSGSGDASINVSDNLEASVSGSGDISYTGGAQHVVKSKSGSGDISRD